MGARLDVKLVCRGAAVSRYLRHTAMLRLDRPANRRTTWPRPGTQTDVFMGNRSVYNAVTAVLPDLQSLVPSRRRGYALLYEKSSIPRMEDFLFAAFALKTTGNIVTSFCFQGKATQMTIIIWLKVNVVGIEVLKQFQCM